MKKQEVKVDPEIMAALLEEPEVKAKIAGMSAEILAWYKELLVSEGIYTRYCKERKAQP